METQEKEDSVTYHSLSIQEQRELLVKKRNNSQLFNNILTPMSLFLPIAGSYFAWFYYTNNKNSAVSFFIFLYMFAPLILLPSRRLRIRQYENDIQELDFRIDLQQFEVNKRETRAEKILRLNDFQLRRYYDLNLNQNTWVFGLGVFCIILGISVIGLTLYLVLGVAQTFEAQVITATLGAIGAVLSNFIAVIYLKMNTAATENLTAFHSKLVETHQLLLGNLLASRIENDEKRWETLSQLSIRLMEKNKDS